MSTVESLFLAKIEKLRFHEPLLGVVMIAGVRGTARVGST